mmetsp:Transcript_48943/g.97277  ORF Transcript_48943/g.97277 Transcript_48943/m.97277 type:complete len:232 (-) Transcript_48943:1243-1938(-)
MRTAFNRPIAAAAAKAESPSSSVKQGSPLFKHLAIASMGRQSTALCSSDLPSRPEKIGPRPEMEWCIIATLVVGRSGGWKPGTELADAILSGGFVARVRASMRRATFASEPRSMAVTCAAQSCSCAVAPAPLRQRSRKLLRCKRKARWSFPGKDFAPCVSVAKAVVSSTTSSTSCSCHSSNHSAFPLKERDTSHSIPLPSRPGTEIQRQRPSSSVSSTTTNVLSVPNPSRI